MPSKAYHGSDDKGRPATLPLSQTEDSSVAV